MGRRERSGVRGASATSIELTFHFRGVRYRERIKLPPTPRNLRHAQNLRARIEHEIALGQFDYAKHFPDSPRAARASRRTGHDTTVGDFLTDWLERIEPQVKSSTYRGYKRAVNGQLIPAFGGLRVTDLRRRHVKDWAAEHSASSKTVRNLISPLRTALDDAVDDELIDVNPLTGWRLRRRDTTPREDRIDPFSLDEQAAILAELKGQARNLLQFAFWTGLRTSELIALDWGDVDFLRGTVVISRAWTQAAGKPETTKTAAGKREVKLLPGALAALKNQKAFTFLAGNEVFQCPLTGKRWTGDQQIRKGVWIPALRRAGVRYRTPYQTRHTFASTALMAGESPMWVARQMGHTNWAFTAKTYSRWIPDNDLQAGKKLAKMWAEPCPNRPDTAKNNASIQD